MRNLLVRAWLGRVGRAGAVGAALGALLLAAPTAALAQTVGSTSPQTVAQNFTTVMMAVAAAAALGFIAGGIVVAAVGSVFGMVAWAGRGVMAVWWGAACGGVAIVAAIARGAIGALGGGGS